MLEIDLNSDLKEEPDLNGRCCFALLWTSNTKILNMSESQFGQICFDMCNFVNMPEYAAFKICLSMAEAECTIYARVLNMPTK